MRLLNSEGRITKGRGAETGFLIIVPTIGKWASVDWSGLFESI